MNAKVRESLPLYSLILCAISFLVLHMVFRSHDIRHDPMSDYGLGGWSRRTFEVMLISQSVYFLSFSPLYKKFSTMMFGIASITAIGPLIVAAFPTGNAHLFGVAWLFVGMLAQIVYAKYKMPLGFASTRTRHFLNCLFWVIMLSLAAFLIIELVLGVDANRGVTQRMFVGSSMIWLTLFTFNMRKYFLEQNTEDQPKQVLQ